MSRSSTDERAPPGAAVEDAPAPHRVAFLIHDLQPGGAERVFVTYVNAAEALAPIAVVVRRRPGLEDEVSESVDLFDLGSRSMVPLPRGSQPGPTCRPPGQIMNAFFGPLALVRKALRLRRLLEAQDVHTVSTFLHKSHAAQR